MDMRKNDERVAPTSFLWAAYLPHRYMFEVIQSGFMTTRRGGRALGTHGAISPLHINSSLFYHQPTYSPTPILNRVDRQLDL